MLFSIRNIVALLATASTALVSCQSMIENCKPGYVAITYDDGPYDYTSELVKLLNSENVKATFFVNGKNFIDLETNEEGRKALKFAHQSQHQIASHTLSHKDLNTLSDEEFDEEIKGLENIVASITDGDKPAFIRPPYGSAEPETVAKLESYGYSVIRWSTDTKDYETHDLESERANIRNSYNSSNTDEGFIILSHDVYEQTTTELTREMIAYTKSQGFKFATVAECVGKPAYQ